MDPRDQARLLRLEHGGHGQNFGNNNLSGYGGGGASSTPPTAQRVDWSYQRNATNNGTVALPANYPRQPGTNTNFASPRRDPKSPATQELKTPTENPRTLDPALLTPASFLEHTRLEGPTANTCLVCNVSFQTNSGLESHAKDAGHSAFLCACDTAFGRLSSLARHINSNTGSGFHCELCGDKALPRLDKLYDHLRDGHKVSPAVLDQHRNKALGRSRKISRPIKPAPAPVATTQVAPSGGFGPSWSSAGQMNGMATRHAMNMAPSSLNGINPAQLTSFSGPYPF
ncbi:hypothetical protein INS49_014122 [Diaporthe citri]|uniref:uncharacterized protein n=1 Tax=Diaporthe citri TaxID=83186 RepID=UPI001C7F03EF|nr:uncharacterized protein INS49_014122 [Diaporthe citri]KAG6358238.1 hypothetical protein INS49_014122 [Diaporthe citri]